MDTMHPLNHRGLIDQQKSSKRRFLDLTVGTRLMMVAIAGAALITWAARLNREYGNPEAMEITLLLTEGHSPDANVRARAFAFLGQTTPRQAERALPFLTAALVEDPNPRARRAAAIALEQQINKIALEGPTTEMHRLLLQRLGTYWVEECRRLPSLEEVSQRWSEPSLRLIELVDHYGPESFPMEVQTLIIGFVGRIDGPIDRRFQYWLRLRTKYEQMAIDKSTSERMIKWAGTEALAQRNSQTFQLSGMHVLNAFARNRKGAAGAEAITQLLTCAARASKPNRQEARRMLLRLADEDREASRILVALWQNDMDPAVRAEILRSLRARIDEWEVCKLTFQALSSNEDLVLVVAVDSVCAMKEVPSEIMPRLKAALYQLDEGTRARVSNYFTEQAARDQQLSP
jgi:HEAT repeats